MTVKAHDLSRLSLLSALDGRARHAVAPYLRERRFDPGQAILFAEEPCRAVYWIADGVVHARYISLEGREYVLDCLGPGSCFNLTPALDGGPTLAHVEALTPAILYSLPRDHFRRLLSDYPALTEATLVYLAGRVRRLSDTAKELALHPVRARLAHFLLAQARDSAHGRHTRRWTQEEIASHIGTVRDVVGRTLRAFTREGLIRRERGQLVISDRAKLEREAMLSRPLQEST